MDRAIPVWFFCLCLLLWAAGAVGYGALVLATARDPHDAGPAGAIAVLTASFPEQAAAVFDELSDYATGDYDDAQVRTARAPKDDYSALAPVRVADGGRIPGLLIRADHETLTPGWRILVGAFEIDGAVENAALLLAPDLSVVRTWRLDEIAVGGETPRPSYRKFPHGFDILKDGSFVFTFDGSVSLQRFDDCGQRMWSAAGMFHHSVTLDDGGKTAWSFSDGRTIAQTDVATGKILRRISMDEIIRRNPDIDILEIRRKHDVDLGRNSRDTKGRWLPDPFHLNDVDPLPAAIADRFPDFTAGDLVVSARSLNLIFVLDPETVHIKWWRIGQTQRQHDPDWLPTGEILVFNNRMSRDYSQAVAIDPKTMASRVLYDGRATGFYSRIRGKQQMLPDGSLAVASSQQGRAFEIGPDGATRLEIANVKPGDDAFNYVISEMRWLPPDYFDMETWRCPLSAPLASYSP